MKDLNLPDFYQCQALKPSGYTFMTLGGKPGDKIPCQAKPYYIVYELHSQEDGLKGSMSLCIDCKNVFINQMGSSLKNYKFAEIINDQEDLL